MVAHLQVAFKTPGVATYPPKAVESWWEAENDLQLEKTRTFHIYVSLQEGQLVIISPVLTGKTDAITSPLDHWLSLNSILQLVNSPLYRHFVCPT